MLGLILWAGFTAATAGMEHNALPLKGSAALEQIEGGEWRFEGELGRRVEANIQNWLLRVVDANPGFIEMFHRRDRKFPFDEPVPWAGEFAGKYLIGAVQAMRMSDDPRVRPFIQQFVDALVACQAENGYLGPWPKDQQLLGHWDLWGHYHCMLGLLKWYDDTGDTKAWDCVLRAANYICDVYAEGGRRPFDAGTPNINLSILHIMPQLYRRTGEPRYQTLIQRVEEDLAKDGDWLQKGEQGVPYYRLPGGGQRWESLHIAEGFFEEYLNTGEDRYKTALANLWSSIRQYDRHPSGAFSTNEQAFGSVYAPGSIETCCSIAWSALSIDMLRLSGDPQVADELELTLWNQAFGSLHPSGNWCTYDNPLDGLRAPAYHQIQFQYRPGTPELNCCSVNASRGLGMVSEWAVMADAKGLFLNFYGPSHVTVPLANGMKTTLIQETNYPAEGNIKLTVSPETETAFTLRLRIPAWSKKTQITLNGAPITDAPVPGTYLAIDRSWKPGDRIELAIDMTPRTWTGQAPSRMGHAVIYHGPLLLSFDAYFNEREADDIPALNVATPSLEPVPVDRTPRLGYFAPMGLWKIIAADGTPVILCDFGSAGAHGTQFVSWLPAANPLPGAVTLQYPVDKAEGAPGSILFRWGAYTADSDRFTLQVARDAAFSAIAAEQKDLNAGNAIIEQGLDTPGNYYWRVLSTNENGSVENQGGPRTFSVKPGAAAFCTIGPKGLLAASALDGNGKPVFGSLALEENLTPAPDRSGQENGALAFNGINSKLRYQTGFFPEKDYSFEAWICPESLPVKGIQQVFSAWCTGMDDPLRVTIDGDSVFARMEARSFFGTSGAPLSNGHWSHVAAVKAGNKLTLYVDGQAINAIDVPEQIGSNSTDIGIGFNPFFSGNEYFKGRIDDFAFYARALTPEEIAQSAAK